MQAALIHRARTVTRAKGARNAQGERTLGPPVEGPWIRARLMERGAVNAQSRRRPNTTDANVSAAYELLLDAVDMETGAPVVVTASSEFLTDCPILGSPGVEAAGKPEKLNDGVTHIGWLVYANVPKDAA